MKIESPAVVQLYKDQHVMTTLVVLGPGHGELAGRMKCVHFGPHTQSSLLGPIDYIRRSGSIIGVRAVHLSAEEMTKGTRIARDLYAEEGRLDDYDAVVAWHKAISDGRPVAPLPDAYLPTAALQWRSNRTTSDVFALPPKEAVEPEAAPEKPVRRRAAIDSPAGGV